MKAPMLNLTEPLIIISNDGQLITDTNYWNTVYARHGICFMSGNAGAWRLLVPDMHKWVLAEMATAKHVEIELGFEQGKRVAKIWFDDRTPRPFMLLMSTEAMDRQMVPTKKRQPLLVYTRDGLQQKHIIRKIT